MPNPYRAHLFPAVLASLMQERGINQVRLSGLSHIAVSRVNNYLKGKYRTIKPAHIEAISRALGGTTGENSDLIEAYLFDLIPEAARQIVDIRAAGAPAVRKWSAPSKDLSARFAAALQELYILCVTNPKVRERTSEWIQIMRETKR